MGRVLLAVAISLIATNAFCYGIITCQAISTGIDCITVADYPTYADAALAAYKVCTNRYPSADEEMCRRRIIYRDFQNQCVAVYTNAQNQPSFAMENAAANAVANALAQCINSSAGGFTCRRAALACDGTGIPLASPAPAPAAKPAPVGTPPTSSVPNHSPNPLPDSLPQVSAVIIAILFFSFVFLILITDRSLVIDFLINGNLPKTLHTYGEEIQVLFKHSQRVNWYGRVVFGLTARLGTTEKQLALVRRYWLGRVVAFDSLRRQRQNELARLHLQLALQAKSDAHDKKKFWSRRWATFRSFVKKLFWVFFALFSFLLSFFFIRVTIAKLARGTLIESKDLVLLLQAKGAIQESAEYLKQYLMLAETFHGQEELFEPE
jgi:hypothetical protein